MIRGFSMGGAACWQFAVHYPDAVVRRRPGGRVRARRAEFLNVFQREKVQPTEYEKKLWHWYDCTDYAVNLFNLPTVAYSGEIDRQKQAADVMARALKAEGIDTDAHHRPEDRPTPTSRTRRRRSTGASTPSSPRGRDPLPEGRQASRPTRCGTTAASG